MQTMLYDITLKVQRIIQLDNLFDIDIMHTLGQTECISSHKNQTSSVTCYSIFRTIKAFDIVFFNTV